MAWHVYVAYFFGGMFLVNAVPHFVSGVMGRRFPSPFASPPGKGESSAVVNVLWGFGNLVVGFVLLHYFWPWCWTGWVAVGAGALAISIQLALHFGKVRAGKP